MDGELVKYLGGGGAVLFMALAWKFSKMWRADDEKLKEEITGDMDAMGKRIDDQIQVVHDRIGKNKEEINKKVDANVQQLSNDLKENNQSLTTIIGKLSKIEGKLDID